MIPLSIGDQTTECLTLIRANTFDTQGNYFHESMMSACKVIAFFVNRQLAGRGKGEE